MALPHCYCDSTQHRGCCPSSSTMSNPSPSHASRLTTLDAALLELGMLSVAISEQPNHRRLRSYSFTTAHDSSASSVLSHRDSFSARSAVSFHDPLSLDTTDSRDPAATHTSVTIQPPNSPVSPSAWLHAQNKSLLFPLNPHPAPPRLDGEHEHLPLNKDSLRSRSWLREPEPDLSDALDRESHLQVLSSLPNSSSSLVMRPRRMRMNSGPCGGSSSRSPSSCQKSASSLVWPYKIPRPRLKREMERVRTRSETLFEVDEANLEANPSALGASGPVPGFVASPASDKENVIRMNSAFDALSIVPGQAPGLEPKAVAGVSAPEVHFSRSKSLEELTLAGANSAGLHAVVDSVSHRIENLHVT